jgi:hypothetical protein
VAPTVEALWAPARRRLTLGLVMTITLVAFEALAISTVMPWWPTTWVASASTAGCSAASSSATCWAS